MDGTRDLGIVSSADEMRPKPTGTEAPLVYVHSTHARNDWADLTQIIQSNTQIIQYNTQICVKEDTSLNESMKLNSENNVTVFYYNAIYYVNIICI